jgi:leucyl aminopeptidase
MPNVACKCNLTAGKTVEVNNTDAEGRLTLADALWFAQVSAWQVEEQELTV